MVRLKEVNKKYGWEKSSSQFNYGFNALLYKESAIVKKAPVQYEPLKRHYGRDNCDYPSLARIEYSFVNENQKLFNTLATKWKQETGLYTLPPKKINETYLQIIAKGVEFLPFILNDIKRGGSVYWHFALKAITGYNEIPDDFNNPKTIKSAWVKWGVDNNIM